MSQAEGHDQDGAGRAVNGWLSTATWWFGEGLLKTMTCAKLFMMC